MNEIYLSPEDAALRFEQLQRKLLPLWDSIQQLSMDEQTIVVVPSMTVDSAISSVMQAYEERFLFLLFLLRQPHARLIYITSQTILPSIVDYYMGLLPGVITSQLLESFKISKIPGLKLSTSMIFRKIEKLAEALICLLLFAFLAILPQKAKR